LKNREDRLQEVDIDIAEFIKHPQYSYRTSKNDIALLRLASNVQFTENIRPACLWQSDVINYTKTIATGYGTLEYASLTSDVLRKVELDILETRQCNSLLMDSLNLSHDKLVDDTQLCAGVLSGGKDTCTGKQEMFILINVFYLLYF
jgi:secreted trypsin-like serine protease